MEEARSLLQKYLPEKAVDDIVKLLFTHRDLILRITRERQSKLGDYKKINTHQHRISINHNLNPYQFLITLLHEMAHYLAYKKHGAKIKPHGREWKNEFKDLLRRYLHPDIFPVEILDQLTKYAQNPKASTAGDGALYLALSQYDKTKNPELKYIFQLKKGEKFQLKNGQSFQLMEKRRTRYKCQNLNNRKIYLIHQNAEVLPLK